jgi:hypothetical protein
MTARLRQDSRQCGREGAIGWDQRRAPQLPSEHDELMSQHEQLDVLDEIAAAAPDQEPEGLQNAGSCGGVVVFVDQSAESVAALDLSAARRRIGGCRIGREQRESAVRALAVVVTGVRA